MEPHIIQILDIILGQWTLAILWILHQQGATRFNKLKRELGHVTAKVLTTRLRRLEQQQIITRTVTPAKIPEVSYQISIKGQRLLPILESLKMVSQSWVEEDIEDTAISPGTLEIIPPASASGFTKTLKEETGYGG